MYRILAAVSLKNIVNNARTIKAYARKRLIAVVKDDAYGHGACRVARALEVENACDAFAVASVEEGAALRTAGIEKDILVLTPCLSTEEGVRLINYNMIASVSSMAAFRLLEGAEELAGKRARVHLAVNTGMNRYGVRCERVPQFCKLLSSRLEGAYSHLYAPENTRALREQQRAFRAVCNAVREKAPNALCHLGATGGALALCMGDAVRVGLALYGYLPAGFKDRIEVKPAMKFYATVSHRCSHTGGGVGYALAKKEYKKLYTLRLGYGDGFFRAGGLGAEGKLCMDACIREGDEKFARRKLILNDVSAYAREQGTSVYEVLARLGLRAEKHYVW